MMTALVWFVLFMQFFQAEPTSAMEEISMPLDDFEAAPEGWEYVGGWEFPGAKGSLEWDEAVAHKGKGSLRLDADFTKGGAYVGLWKRFGELNPTFAVRHLNQGF